MAVLILIHMVVLNGLGVGQLELYFAIYLEIFCSGPTLKGLGCPGTLSDLSHSPCLASQVETWYWTQWKPLACWKRIFASHLIGQPSWQVTD